MNEYSYLLSFRLSNSEDKENYDKRRDALLTKFDAKSVFDTDKKENEDKTEPTTSTIIWESNDYIDSVIKTIQDILDFEDIALIICMKDKNLESIVRIFKKHPSTHKEEIHNYSSLHNLLFDIDIKEEEKYTPEDQQFLDDIDRFINVEY